MSAPENPPALFDTPDEQQDPRTTERQRQELALRAAAPMRGRTGSAGLADCPLFDPGLGL